jgi:ADP-heptose:LPS heptosyltransferase
MKLSTVVLGGDTGMPHLALALGKRVIVVMHSNQPGTCIPFHHADWTLTPAAGQTMAGISSETVNAACAKAWAEL